jgi:hypothetical protein
LPEGNSINLRDLGLPQIIHDLDEKSAELIYDELKFRKGPGKGKGKGKGGFDNHIEGKEPTPKQKEYVEFAKKFAKEFIGIDIHVRFIKASVKYSAEFGGNTLTYIVNKLPKNFFDEITEENTNLLIHELGHHDGVHTDMSYHRLLTKLGAKSTMMALKKPSFFSL